MLNHLFDFIDYSMQGHKGQRICLRSSANKTFPFITCDATPEI